MQPPGPSTDDQRDHHSATSTCPGTGTSTQFDTPRKADGPIRIQIITNGISPFWDPMAIGMKKAAAEMGCEAEWAGPQSSEVGAQKQLVESALAKDVGFTQTLRFTRRQRFSVPLA